ncbi:hypothetical protein PSENEW3_00003218 [Picochlorum sp. SENEW3]|nr:hypothetical protein PSENEW3_00003218 [Picochlorum sp. SENEW3]
MNFLALSTLLLLATLQNTQARSCVVGVDKIDIDNLDYEYGSRKLLPKFCPKEKFEEMSPQKATTQQRSESFEMVSAALKRFNDDTKEGRCAYGFAEVNVLDGVGCRLKPGQKMDMGTKTYTATRPSSSSGRSNGYAKKSVVVEYTCLGNAGNKRYVALAYDAKFTTKCM